MFPAETAEERRPRLVSISLTRLACSLAASKPLTFLFIPDISDRQLGALESRLGSVVQELFQGTAEIVVNKSELGQLRCPPPSFCYADR